MAIVVTNKLSTKTTSVSSFNTASQSPTADTLQLLTVTSRTGITADPNQPTVTGNGLTWVAVNTTVYDIAGSSRKRVTLFRAMGASPSAGAITVDFGGQTQSDITVILDEASGTDTTGSDGAGAIVQSAVNQDTTASSSTLTVTLAAFASGTNTCYAAMAASGGTAATLKAGFTLAGTNVGAGNQVATVTEYKLTSDTTPSVTWTSGGELGGLAVEIKEAGGGSATNLTLNDANNAHVADSIVLTSSTSLAVQDASHIHSADSVVLSSSVVLSVADSLHALLVDNIVLSTFNVVDLILADASHSHTVDNIGLTVDAISVNDSLHSQAADNITLSTENTTNIVVAEGMHGHTVDSFVLTSIHHLVVADSIHAHQADNLTLGITGQATLIMADGTHAHSVDNLDFSLEYYLSVQEALHEQLADSISFSANSNLIVNDCLHALLAESCNVSILDFRQYPLAGLTQARPITDIQQYPLAGQVQTRPLG